MFFFSTAMARTWVVDAGGAGDTTSLQAAVDAAAAGDSIQINAGTYPGLLSWADKDLQILGAGSDQVVLDGAGAGTTLVLANLSASSRLSGVRVANSGLPGLATSAVSAVFTDLVFDGLGHEGAYGGAVYLGGGSPSFESSVFSSNLGLVGGAIYADAGTVLSLREVELSANDAVDSAGAVYLADGASLDMSGGSLADNLAANYGGGVCAAGGTELLFSGVSLEGNGAESLYGGAIYAGSSARVDLSGSTIEGNSSGYHGGAVYLAYGASLRSNGDLWQDNVAYYYGGDIFGEQLNELLLEESSFGDSIATYGYGGSIYAQYGTQLSASGCSWSTPYAYYNGGAIYLYVVFGLGRLEDVSFDGGVALYGGGGAIALQYGQLALTRASFVQNEASASTGGAIWAYSSVGLSLSEVEFEGNYGAYAGGAVAYDSYATGAGGLSVDACAFDSNWSDYEGGAISAGTGDGTLIEGSRFRDNRGGSYGGAVSLHDSFAIVARNNDFVRNSGGYGGAVYVVDSLSGNHEWQNNLFQENSASIGGAGAWADNGATTLENNSFVGNSAAEAGGVLALAQTRARLRNNLFGWTTSGSVLYAYDEATVSGSEISFNAVWEAAGGEVGGSFGAEALRGSIDEDPGLVAYSADNDADNDLLLLRTDSPLVDAGSPDLLDPDGGPSDIGATGGPWAEVVDADGDGADRFDCDDADPAIHPGAGETWYDGVDQDCDGQDDDQDEDGLGAAEDCDDADPEVGACPEDGGKAPTGEGCACGGGEPGAGPGLLAAGWLLGRRRTGPRRSGGA